MRKLLLLVILFLALPAAAQAQFTLVTGTVTDTNGLAYACGTISAQLIVPGGTAPTLNGGGFTTQTSPVQLGCPTVPGSGPSGSFTMRLADNNVVSPSGTQWKFTANGNAGPPPLGTGPQVCTATLTITGGSQSVTASFSACPALSNAAGSSGIFPGPVLIGASPPSLTAGSAGFEACVEGTPPTAVSSVDFIYCDSTQRALEVNNNNTGAMPVSRLLCVSVSPTTVAANVTTDQNLLACTVNANTLNVVGRTLKIYAAGVYSTAAGSTAQLTFKVKLCSVSGCGSGVVVPLTSIQTAALGTVTVVNDPFALNDFSTTQTAGASSVYEAHGTLSLGITATNTASTVLYNDTNTAVSSPVIDSTAQLFLQVTGAFSAASASNSFTQRQLIVEAIN